MPQGVERFLFGAVNPRALAVFRALLAVMIVLVFDSARVAPPYRLLTLAALVLFAAGVRPRAFGAVAVALLVPVYALGPVLRSGQILLFTLLALVLVGNQAGPIWPIRLIQLQLSLLYGVNALAKTTPGYLRGDTLVGFADTLPNFVATIEDRHLLLGPFAVPVALAACASVAAEYALALGFWLPRLRVATAVFGVVFHLVLKLVIRIGWLDWTCVFLYLAFLLPLSASGTIGGGEAPASQAGSRRRLGVASGGRDP